MCGFVMTLSANGRSPDVGLTQRMAQLLAHRGPDDEGVFSEHQIAFAFRRLAILDLSAAGHQPLFSIDERQVIVFNGAIYNFIELRAELSALGHLFRSSGDTEVLLAAFRQWGADCLHRLNGMWAFVVYDRDTRRIFAARDRFGVKPLFWFYDARGLVLASEIKALRDSNYAPCAPNQRVIARFLVDGEIDNDDQTFYSDVQRVPAGSYFEGDATSAPIFRRYWNLAESAADLEEPSAPVENFRDLFDDAVRLRMRADVPTGVLLSGGLDSTAIVTSMAAQRSRGGGAVPAGLEALAYLDPEFNEQIFIDATLKQTRATLQPLDADPEKIWKTFEHHLWYQDEPVHSFTSAIVYLLMELARDNGLKVILNGQGADEALAGYPTYFVQHWADLVRAGQFRHAQSEIAQFARAHERSPLKLKGATAWHWFNSLRRRIPWNRAVAARRHRYRVHGYGWLGDHIKQSWTPEEDDYSRTLANALRHAIERSALPLYLRVDDRNSMAHGVEVRLPFMDHRLVALSFRLGSQWKLRGAYTKFVLRAAMRGRIPEIVRTRVQKFGFPTSATRVLQTALRERCRALMRTRAVRDSGFFNVPEIDRLLNSEKTDATFSKRLFHITQLAMWQNMSRPCLIVTVLLSGLRDMTAAFL
jgi:asparagine synthase (glutamine-hydrolysing)